MQENKIINKCYQAENFCGFANWRCSEVCDLYNVWDLSTVSGNQALWRPRCIHPARVGCVASIGKWEVEEMSDDTST